MPLKHVKTVKAKGKAYFYFDTGKRVGGKKVYAPLPHKDDPTFARVYATLLGHRHRNRDQPQEQMLMPALVDLYQRSPEYRALTASSRRVYDIYLARLIKLLPTAPVAQVQRRDMYRLFDSMGQTPGAANLFLGVAGAVFKWAKSRDYITVLPTADIKPMPVGTHEPWPRHVLDAALDAESDIVRLLTRLLYYTAQRLNDVLDMTWQEVATGNLVIRQTKTDKDLTIRLHESLLDELRRTPRRGLTIVTTERGARMDEDRARKLLKDFVASHGIVRVPHGLRKNAVNALLEAGATVAQTQAVSGQSLQLVEHYAKQRDQQKLASAAVLIWERNEPGPGKQGKTGS